jgi:hypothetical protein
MTWEAEFDLAVMTGHAFQCIDGLGAFLAGAGLEVDARRTAATRRRLVPVGPPVVFPRGDRTW